MKKLLRIGANRHLLFVLFMGILTMQAACDYSPGRSYSIDSSVKDVESEKNSATPPFGLSANATSNYYQLQGKPAGESTGQLLKRAH